MEASLVKVCTGEVSSAKIDRAKIRVAEVRSSEVHSAEVISPTVRSSEVRSAEIHLLSRFRPPFIPNGHALLEDRQVFWVRHGSNRPQGAVVVK
jgi:hypothetical protein